MKGVKIKEPIGIWVLVADELKAINRATFLQIESLSDISQALLKQDDQSKHNWRRWLTMAAHKLSPYNGASFGFSSYEAAGHCEILDKAKAILDSDKGTKLATEVTEIVMSAMLDRNSQGLPDGSTPLMECARAVYSILCCLTIADMDGVIRNGKDSAKHDKRH